MIFCLVAVYDLHTIHTKKQLWEDLKQMVSTVQVPMICMGDFNAVLSGDDIKNESSRKGFYLV
ncbi:hypothetical protein RDI58_003937 [Solanum bulbocastanum]|uniref:Uncharacterized protein n=1 Tax=Solanum bulbocastanum TaxID=147425 RepID=A0AAN8U4U9_SOLBU